VPAKAIPQLETSSLEEDTRKAYSVLRKKCDPRAYDLLAMIEKRHVEALRFTTSYAERKLTWRPSRN
jgi:hypothetical protein